ncbi:MAG: hypothetical protein NXH91_02645 [Phyllobacteriaceae bacterium]|jgi:hypothetical protein|nr:hypothetical protein [Phyllobacteriaceae bacterium]
MAEDPENLTLQLLRQIRDEQQAMRSEQQAMRDDLETINTKLDGNTLILNFVAGLVSDHEDRITALEAKDTEPAE